MPETISPEATAPVSTSHRGSNGAGSKAAAQQTTSSSDVIPTPFHSAETKPLDALVFIGIVLFVFVMMVVIMMAY